MVAQLNILPPNSPLLSKSGFLNPVWYRYFVSLTKSTSDAQAGQVLTPVGSGLQGGGFVSDGLTLSLAPGGVQNSNLADMLGFSVKGNINSGSATPQDLTANADNRVLGRVAGVLGFLDNMTLRSVSFGQIFLGMREVSASTTWTTSDYAIIANASGGAVTLTLPALQPGLNLVAKKVDSSVNAVTLSGAANIDGAASKSLTTQYQSIRLIGGTTEWHVI